MSDRPQRAHLPKARAASQRTFAIRATEDPVRLARAARIVRVALERNLLTIADLVDNDAAA